MERRIDLQQKKESNSISCLISLTKFSVSESALPLHTYCWNACVKKLFFVLTVLKILYNQRICEPSGYLNVFRRALHGLYNANSCDKSGYEVRLLDWCYQRGLRLGYWIGAISWVWGEVTGLVLSAGFEVRLLDWCYQLGLRLGYWIGAISWVWA